MLAASSHTGVLKNLCENQESKALLGKTRDGKSISNDDDEINFSSGDDNFSLKEVLSQVTGN